MTHSISLLKECSLVAVDIFPRAVGIARHVSIVHFFQVESEHFCALFNFADEEYILCTSHFHTASVRTVHLSFHRVSEFAPFLCIVNHCKKVYLLRVCCHRIMYMCAVAHITAFLYP